MDRKLVRTGKYSEHVESPALSERAYVRIRFVGGPWHNKLMVCKPIAIQIVPYIDADAAAMRLPALVNAKYLLRHFVTDYFDTPYAQYVHESLIGADGLTHLSCEHEVFDTFKLKRLDCKRK